MDLYLIPFDLRYMLKTEGKRPVAFRDVCISKFVVMAVFLSCQEEHLWFRVTFQLFKGGGGGDYTPRHSEQGTLPVF